MRSIFALLLSIMSVSATATECPDFFVSGQSNASRADWTIFEQNTGYTVQVIARGGFSIDMLHTHVPRGLCFTNAKGLIFVHGETDATNDTDPDYYIYQVERYRNRFKLPMYISSVGYRSNGELDAQYDAIREAQELKVQDSCKWSLSYSDAKHFRDWGYMIDRDHFSPEGYKLMIDAISRDVLEDFPRY